MRSLLRLESLATLVLFMPACVGRGATDGEDAAVVVDAADDGDAGASRWTRRFILNDPNGPPPHPSGPVFAWTGPVSKAILFSGGGAGGGPATNDVWGYDPEANTWTQRIGNGIVGSPPARMLAASAWDGTQLIVFGGIAGAFVGDCWWYTPSTNTWIQKLATNTPGAPADRAYHAMVWDGTRAIMFGGTTHGPAALNDLWWYEPATNTWTEKIVNGAPGSPPLTYPSQYGMVWDGTRVILCMAGAGGNDNSLWWYSPATNAWTEKLFSGALGSPARRHGLTCTWTGSKMVLFGGTSNGGNFDDTWEYDPATNAWTQAIAPNVEGSPPSSTHHAMIFDGTRGVMYTGDTWWYAP